MALLGYKNPLYLLPFDHRATFTKNLLGFGETLTGEQKKMVRAYKRIVYDAFVLALSRGVPEDGGAILVDEEYGQEILLDAHKQNFVTCLTVEKSGQEEFVFEYGDDFRAHIKKINPAFVKALIRYNPEGDTGINERQRKRLKVLSDFAHKEGYKFLLEPLVPPTEENLKDLGGDKEKYDREVRPSLTTKMMMELQNVGIEPDVWKIEGMRRQSDYQRIAAVARNRSARADVGVVILGRGEKKEEVVAWIKAGKNVRGVIGFAVGRTVFLLPLVNFKNKLVERQEAVEKIAENYKYFYEVFTNEL
ncbi:MAG: DUF2090 domain-containing protein [Patescibacteria group bacterium]